MDGTEIEETGGESRIGHELAGTAVRKYKRQATRQSVVGESRIPYRRGYFVLVMHFMLDTINHLRRFV